MLWFVTPCSLRKTRQPNVLADNRRLSRIPSPDSVSNHRCYAPGSESPPRTNSGDSSGGIATVFSDRCAWLSLFVFT
jgi:hypothetical protein